MKRISGLLTGALLLSIVSTSAQAQAQAWTEVGMLRCKLNPSVGFIIAGHQSMECRFTQKSPLPPQNYYGAINTVGIDLGVSAGGTMAWAVFAPTTGAPDGALAGEYVGASGDVGVGLGVGTNVLLGGSNRSVALQPVSVEGSVALDVVLGLSALKLQWVPGR